MRGDARWLIRFHGLRHPREMGAPEVEAFLTYLAVERKVSASTQNHASSITVVATCCCIPETDRRTL